MANYLGAMRFPAQDEPRDFGLFQTHPLTGSIGATIAGLDLAKPLSSSLVDAIHQALLHHLVLFFQGQELTASDLVRLGSHFGDLHINPFAAGTTQAPEVMTVRSEENTTLRFAEKWHSDISWERCPAMASMLYAEKVPAVGGDTLFANMYLAYDTLHQATREMLEGRRAIHTAMINHDSTPQFANLADETVSHPVFRTHPTTGNKALFVNEYFTCGIENMDEDEAWPLLQRLFQHAVRPDFCCRYRWRRGDLAFWDNRCTQHYATNDYAGHSRLMLRVTIVGDKPF
ncbi:MAG: TauD/TfdA family dioxygenase [Pseudomonadota bacterium]